MVVFRRSKCSVQCYLAFIACFIICTAFILPGTHIIRSVLEHLFRLSQNVVVLTFRTRPSAICVTCALLSFSVAQPVLFLGRIDVGVGLEAGDRRQDRLQSEDPQPPPQYKLGCLTSCLGGYTTRRRPFCLSTSHAWARLLSEVNTSTFIGHDMMALILL